MEVIGMLMSDGKMAGHALVESDWPRVAWWRRSRRGWFDAIEWFGQRCWPFYQLEPLDAEARQFVQRFPRWKIMRILPEEFPGVWELHAADGDDIVAEAEEAEEAASSDWQEVELSYPTPKGWR